MNLALGVASLLACVVAPGWAVVRGLSLASAPLPAFVIAASVGRVLFAGATLLATATGGRGLLIGFAVAATALAAGLEWRERRRGGEAGDGPARLATVLPPALAIAAALLLVHAVVGRSGLENAAGELIFFGRDATNDPLVYGAIARQLARTGLPIGMPFAGGWPVAGSYGHFAVEAGLHLVSGASILDLSFRVLPIFDTVTLTLSGVALTRALGGRALAAGAAGLLIALGCEASFLVAPVAALLGHGTAPLDSWALFGPYLLPFNPGGAALQLLFAAALLVARPAHGAAIARAAVAGLLVATLFEWKVFLWAPVVTALVAVAWCRPPLHARRTLRVASLFAVLGSLPSLLDRLLRAQAAAGSDETALELCAFCLPRYLANAAWGSGDLSFALFRSFHAADLLRADMLAGSATASVCFLAVVLGARLAALPTLGRGSRGDGGPAAVHRWLGVAAGLGLAGSMVLVTRPHYLNGAQLAWIATFGLWPAVALQLERWWSAGRLVPAVLVLALALPGSIGVIGRMGYGAPIWMRVPEPERALLARLPEVAGPGDVVLEPSMLMDTDRPSPLPWLVGQPVYLSLLSAVQSLPERERNRRFEELTAVFAGSDADAARRALESSGARFVYAPSGWRLRFAPGPLLEPVLQTPAGVIYRVRGRSGSAPATR